MDLKKKEERLQKLTEFWYDYVSCDHHKDRDCHFYINKVWSYGKEPYYRPEHYPYMGNDFDLNGNYDSYEGALDALLEYLETEVRDAHQIPQNWDDTKVYDYNYAGVVAVLKGHNLHPIRYSDFEDVPF